MVYVGRRKGDELKKSVRMTQIVCYFLNLGSSVGASRWWYTRQVHFFIEFVLKINQVYLLADVSFTFKDEIAYSSNCDMRYYVLFLVVGSVIHFGGEEIFICLAYSFRVRNYVEVNIAIAD